MEKIRTFIAVKLPGEVRRRLAEIEKRLMESGADVKWVPEENFHITLKFLGGVEQAKMSGVREAVERAASGVRPFDLGFAGVGSFGRPTRVVWVGIESGRDELRSLAALVDGELAGVGFPREDRPFGAHVTLGRVRSPRGAESLRERIEELKNERAGSAPVDGVSVMRSELRPGGPVYTALADVRF
ncbi:MAG: RNA 2',3'-cyclic phosphodiesterase [Armatimonadetes bacterium]|nr:RNA 2',3'-cyclic phosphodiesterase [Armatimonadota bacterium]